MRGRNLRFESLESRCLLTAVVTETGGVVTIQGDGDAEDVVITQVEDNQFEISGDVEDDNGDPGPFTFNNITAINVDLAGGADTLTVNGNGNEGLLADLDVDLGAGLDAITLDNLRLTGALNIIGEAADGPDATDVNLDQTRAKGGATIQTGAGEDTFDIVDSRFRGGFELNANDGDDTAVFEDFRSRGGDTTIDLGLGFDQLSMVDARFRGDVDIFGGNDAEDALAVALFDARVRGGDLNIQGGGGNDEVGILRLDARGNVDIDTFDGHDDVTLLDSEVRGNLDVDLGAHDDDLVLENSRFQEAVDLDGGPGNSDRLRRATSEFEGAVNVQGFENDDDD
jgi:hypothetical protein